MISMDEVQWHIKRYYDYIEVSGQVKGCVHVRNCSKEKHIVTAKEQIVESLIASLYTG